MSKRLQVLLDEAEMRRVRRAARREGTTVSEWVRRALRVAMRKRADGDPDEKIAAIRAAARHRFPAPGIERMLAEIERAYLDDSSE